MTSPVASIAEPQPHDAQAALVVLIYWAREWLSDVERGCDTNDRLELATRAASYLHAAYHLAVQNADADADTATAKTRLSNSLQRAREASEALIHNVRVLLAYAKELDARIEGRSASEFHSTITRGAAKYAKQEAHRALVSAVELFPKSFRMDLE